MATYAERLAELEQQQANERSALERQCKVLTALESVGLGALDWSVHMHKLYDRDGSAHLRPQQYESLRKGPDPTPDTIRQLWAAFPDHQDLTVYRDGCVGIRTASDAKAAEVKANERNQEPTLTPIAPFWIRIDAADGDADWCWITSIAGLTIECCVTLRLYTLKLGALSVRREAGDWRRDHPGRVISNTFAPAQAITVINNSRVELIKYGSGSPERPGDHLLYWNSADTEHGAVTPLDVLERMTNAHSQTNP